jgi:HAD superfamily hydrolase (TIGR01549 family)
LKEAPTTMSEQRVILLDVDGTLIDSNDAHADAWVEALEEFAYKVTFARIRTLIGKGADKLLPEAVGVEKESTHGKVISARRSQLFMQKYLPTLKAFPSARELLQKLDSSGFKLVVATSAQKNEMKALLRVAGLDDLIDDAASAKDADASKPDPDIVQAALRRAGCSPEQAIMLGDTPYDIEAAAKAGVRAIAVRCGGWADAQLRGAIAIYDSPHDLLRHYARSPLAGWRVAS